ncbi:alpha/beta hydrolase [Kaistia geumhonensis]|uniref:Pimeloyl-ACP methyl ester carboxylesterase n=1 Tax=Kaistia geumhonensis TaxID=410839 RepID=A0ABU0M5D0_9HYPH|nr:alpha/beta hydrolase [Kaistia geumhonensis]MCX5478626.1 alpha/beta hydrolase [Kaistia geumhonensis]MDQ0516156.1 pimeloyl-ACP methyl ester carboxylesterase [Kaistia geumhonensis]
MIKGMGGAVAAAVTKRTRAARKRSVSLLPLVVAASFAGLAAYNHVRARQAVLRALRGRLMHVGAVRLHVLDEGVGMPLVLLHGNGSAAEDFVASGLIGAASGRYRVLAFDRPGFGASSRPRGPIWTPAAQADLIHAALRQLGIERYLVLGHSFGASVALECALRHPEAVAGVIAVSGYYFPKPRPALAFASLPAVPILGTIARYTVLPLLARKTWPLVLEKMFRPAPIAPRFSASLRELACGPEGLRSVAAESALLIAASAMVPDYSRITAPVGILAGDADDLIDAAEQAGLLKAAIPGALVDIVPHAGHMVQQTAPDAVLAMIDRIETARRAA